MAIVYVRLNDTEPIRPEYVSIEGSSYAAYEGRNNDPTSFSYKYDFAEKRMDIYYQKDEKTLNATVAKVEINATEQYGVAKHLKWIIDHPYTHADKTILVNGIVYTKYPDGTMRNPNGIVVEFNITFNDRILDAVVDQIGGAIVDEYEGPYYVTPKVTEQVLDTKNKLMTKNTTIYQIPYDETHNLYGTTVVIGLE